MPIDRFPWVHSELDRPNAAAWAARELGCQGQTLEISRFQSTRAEGIPGPVSREYYESLGPAAARVLVGFYETRKHAPPP